MGKRYLVTGATGFLGRAVVSELAARGAEVYALVLKGDPLAGKLPERVITAEGNICDKASLEPFFEYADGSACVIHCAGIVSVASKPGAKLYQVNVDGVRNLLEQCAAHQVGKLVYVSSVHAIPEKPKGIVMSEPQVVLPELVKGDYAKSKAEATRLVLAAAKDGLNASVVFPSGVIGPGDLMEGSITYMLRSFLAGKLPLAVSGGYDFADVRDVAKGIVACAEGGLPGHGYILSGHYAAVGELLKTVSDTFRLKRVVRCLPIGLARLAAPIYEQCSLRRGRPLYFTPYSIAVLASNGRFSYQKAALAFGYAPRSLQITLRDTIRWLQGGSAPPDHGCSYQGKTTHKD